MYFVNGNGREAVSQFLVHVILVSTRGSHLSKTFWRFFPSGIVNDRTEKDRTEWCTTVAEGEKITKKGVGRGEGLHGARDKKEPVCSTVCSTVCATVFNTVCATVCGCATGMLSFGKPPSMPPPDPGSPS